MSTRKSIVPDEIADYLESVLPPEPPPLAELRLATQNRDDAGYQLDPHGGHVLTVLVELMAARRTLDIGTYTGYSALAMALAMGPEGHVVTLDVDPTVQEFAATHWQTAGVSTQITAMAGPAKRLLDDMILEQGEAGGFDLVLIDADKENYATYYEQALVLTRPGGAILFDNVLWRGRVADPNETGARTQALRQLNTQLRYDDRVTSVLLPVGDGLAVARKRP